MKIAFVIGSECGTGGIERVVAVLAQYLYAQGNKVVIVFLDSKFNYPFGGEVVELLVKTRRSKFGKLWSDCKRFYKLLLILKVRKFDLIYNLFWLAPLSSCRKRMVSAVHLDPNYVTFLYRFLIKNFLFLSGKIIVPSSGAADIMTYQWGMRNVIFINNPLDFDYIDKMSRDSLPEHIQFLEPYILTVGRLVKEKNFSLLIKAYALSITKEKCLLVIIGEGDQKDELQDLVRAERLEDRVLFLGVQNNPFVFMKNCLFFVSSSVTESFSMVVAEALLCGSAVISTDCLGPKELIKHRHNGLLIPSGNILEMAHAMDELYSEDGLREGLRKNACQSIEHLKLETIMHRHREVFDEIINSDI